MTDKQETKMTDKQRLGLGLFLIGLVIAGAIHTAITGRTALPIPPLTMPTTTSAAPTPTDGWTIGQLEVNPIDGVKTQGVQLYAAEPVARRGAGVFGLKFPKLIVCYENGDLCRHTVGVFVEVHGMIAPVDFYERHHQTRVRLRFDDDKPITQIWTITDDGTGMTPHGRERWFLAQLQKHHKLILEFAFFEKVPQTITFQVAGLAEKLPALAAATKQTETR